MREEDIWWASRWVDPLLEARELRVKVRKGRVLARRGRVRDVGVRPGLVTAVVDEDHGGSCSVRLRLPLVDDDVWSRVVERIAQQAGQAAMLLGGRLTPEMIHFFDDAGVEIFPFDHHDLTYFCTCSDEGPICLHAVALHFVLADVFRGDPLALLALRGRERDALVAEVRARGPSVGEEAAVDEAAPDPTEPPDALADAFWEAGVIPHLAFRLSPDDVASDDGLPVVRALGPAPGEVPPEAVADVLAPIVRQARRRIDALLDRVAEDDSAVQVPRPTESSSLDDVLVAAAWQHGSLTSAFVAEALGVPKLQARRYLKWLVDEGRLRVVGRARGTRYEPVG